MFLLWVPGCVEQNSGIPQNRLNRVSYNPSWRPMLSMSCFLKENAKRVALIKFWLDPAVQQTMSIEREQIVMYADTITQPRLDKTSPTESVDSASIAFFAIHNDNLIHHQALCSVFFVAFRPWFVLMTNVQLVFCFCFWFKSYIQYLYATIRFQSRLCLRTYRSHVFVHISVIYFYLCVYLHLSPGHSRVVFLLGAAAWPSIDPEVITKRPTRPTLLYSDHPTTRRAIHKHKTHICNTHT